MFYVVTDHLGTPKELVTEDGKQTVWSGEMGVWGKARNDAEQEPAYGEKPKPKTDCKIRFQGQWEDQESGLHYNRHRYYDPDAAQYISPDPIGLEGGTNPQSYVSDPSGWVDPLGLAVCPIFNVKSNRWHDPETGRFVKPPTVNQHFNGTTKPMTSGATPNSMYTHMDSNGRAVQNAIYDGNGNVIAHVDFKNHGIESGHWHTFPQAGNPASGHGRGKPHLRNSLLPLGWDALPSGVTPHTPIGQ